MYNRFNLFLYTIPLLCWASAVYAKIITEDVQGQVKVRAPLSLTWSEVSSDEELDEGMLIQIRKNSRVTLRFEGDSIMSSVQGTDARITISTPTVLRVTPNIIRAINKQRKYMKAIPNLGSFSHLIPSGQKVPEGKILAGWQGAFERVSTAIIGSDDPNQNVFQKTSKINTLKSQQSQFSVQVGQTPIEIINPSTFEVLPTHLPKKFRIEWIQPKEMNIQEANLQRKIGYRLYFWLSTTDKPKEPIAITSSEKFSLPIKNYGTYWLQIESTNNKFTSEPKLIQAVPKNSVSQAGSPDNREVHVEYPMPKFPNVSTVVSLTKAEKEASITFVWTNPTKQQIHGKIIDMADNREAVATTFQSNQHHATFDLAPGEYTWQMQTPLSTNSTTIYFRIRFRVVEAQDVDYFSYILDSNPDNQSDVVFYLPSGL